jgi:hypothetical protein
LILFPSDGKTTIAIATSMASELSARQAQDRKHDSRNSEGQKKRVSFEEPSDFRVHVFQWMAKRGQPEATVLLTIPKQSLNKSISPSQAASTAPSAQKAASDTNCPASALAISIQKGI